MWDLSLVIDSWIGFGFDWSLMCRYDGVGEERLGEVGEEGWRGVQERAGSCWEYVAALWVSWPLFNLFVVFLFLMNSWSVSWFYGVFWMASHWNGMFRMIPGFWLFPFNRHCLDCWRLFLWGSIGFSQRYMPMHMFRFLSCNFFFYEKNFLQLLY